MMHINRKMVIPRHGKTIQLCKEKTCKICGESYIPRCGGQKYCDKCLNEYSRYELTKMAKNIFVPQGENIYLTYNVIETRVDLRCACCGSKYSVILNGEGVYPKYCEAHRNHHQRERYEKHNTTNK
jgi:hypothetical protein